MSSYYYQPKLLDDWMINLVLNDIAEKHLRCGFLMKVSFPDR